MLSLVVAPCFIVFIWFCYFMDQRQKRLIREPEIKLCMAMSATPVLARLLRQRESLLALGVDDEVTGFDVQIARLEKVIAAAPPEKKDPYLEYGEAEVEILLS